MEMDPLRLQAAKAAALEAALAGGEVLKEGFGRAHKARTKSSATDLVTEYDERAQAAIVEVLRRRGPDPEYGILAEEGYIWGEESAHRWLVDPLDGTTNYAHGYPIFCVSIALEGGGRPQVGVVYAPCLEEIFTAARGEGATRNGRVISVSRTPTLEASLLCTGFPYRRERISLNLRYFDRFVHRAQAVRRDGAAALDLCWVAMGRFDGFWELDLKPWDVAAGALIVREAGGRVSDLGGGPLELDRDRDRDRDGDGDVECLASNGLIHEEMLAVLRPERGIA